MKLSNKGFTVLEGAFIVIVIAVVAGAGFYVANANKKNSVTTSITSVQPEAKKAVTEAPKQEYEEFANLGFKIPKTAIMADWSYVSEDDLPNTRYVRSAAHVKQIDACNADGGSVSTGPPSGGSFAAFSRVDGTYDAGEGTELDGFIKQFDSFYITIGYPNGGSPCSNENGAGYPVGRALPGTQQALKAALEAAEEL